MSEAASHDASSRRSGARAGRSGYRRSQRDLAALLKTVLVLGRVMV